jgi:hypothetical protein
MDFEVGSITGRIRLGIFSALGGGEYKPLTFGQLLANLPVYLAK